MAHARLDALNAMLRITGEYAVDTELELHPDVVTCKAVLDERRKEELSEGLWFNKTIMTMFRSPSGEILYTEDAVLSLDATDVNVNVSLRGGRLYDNDNNTYTFTSDIEVEIVSDMDEDEIPPIAMAHIKWLAVVEYGGINQITGTAIVKAQESSDKATTRFTAEKYRKADVSFNNTPMAQRMFAFREKFSTTRRTNYNGSASSRLRKT